MPNRKDVRNPTTENMFEAFQYIVSGEVIQIEGKKFGFVSELSSLQKEIISLLEIPVEAFSYNSLFNSE